MARRILVVDDEAAVCESIRRVLAVDHHDIQIANTGHEALALFKREKFDVVIIDYEMPAMKGDKVAAAIKALAPQQPIILITAYGESLRLAGDFPLEVDRVLGKPFDLQEMRAAVQQLATKS